ncbi:MAG: hypothetical protein OQJ96_06295 [Flavobacteriales bacterium]|nr:hypothetical protein [Flavobacteriales bacterium]MCW8937688.1 hypothetical protein [Flavobacteriales bacterium]MCW8969501.1 hypothetical protein [Flavobacteriales bacterium]MCW8990176.1 hypothetical protein [Flavobacteriales bacterium]MCW9019894.1 hypothetical protein [Flavobacteriales bacterium]
MRVNLITILFSLLYFFYCYILKDYIFYSSLGLSFTLYIFIDFVSKLGKTFPIKEFIILIASLQWIVGAKISFSLGKTHHKYYMYVEEDVYMSYVVPGVLAMTFGLYLIRNSLPIDKIKTGFIENNRKTNISTAYTLVAIGLLSGVINKFINIGGLAFILYLSSLLLYVGIGYLFFLFPKYKWHLFFVTLGITFVTSLGSGMFHNMLIIASFFAFLVTPNKTSFVTKLTVITLGAFFIYMLQVVKKDFREIIWSGKKVNPVEVFYDLIEREFLVEKETEAQPLGTFQQQKEEQKSADANNRLNQGWIISKVLDNVPSKKPFLEGKTIKEAIEASLLPRFLAPDKAGADQALVNFKEITGLGLSKNASMGLSLIAEFYANYGIAGGWIAMFLYGLLLSISITLIMQYLGKSSYLMILWLILFFFQVVKAETDFIKIFNHLVKSLIFFMIVNVGLSFIGIQLFSSNNQKDELE